MRCVVAVLYALVIQGVLGREGGVKDQLVLVQGEDSTFMVGGDSASVFVARDSPKQPPAPRDDLVSVEPFDEEFMNIMGSDLSKAPEVPQGCAAHRAEEMCVVDVTCGWCLVNGGGHCVTGDFAGPRNKSENCPVYITYQQPVPEEVSEDESHLWDGATAPPSDPWPSPQKFNATITPDEEPNDLESDVEEATFPDPEPDVRSPWGQKPNSTAHSRTVPHPASPAGSVFAPAPMSSLAPNQGATSGYDANVSPCGLPGVPSFICDAWLKLHCGPDQLTDSVLQVLKAANNGYDWCATMFENEPGVFQPPPAPRMPWYINGQLVQ